jgi:hypothetical protein
VTSGASAKRFTPPMTDNAIRIAPLRERTHTMIVRVPQKISDAVYDLATKNDVLPRDVVCFAIEQLISDSKGEQPKTRRFWKLAG